MKRARARGDRAKARDLRRQLRRLPSGDPQDPGYRRLRYTRYADDHLLGFTGPKAEAEAIKDQLARFLRDDLALELNPNKTLITHARTQAARYLGYEIIVQHCDDENHQRPPVGQREPSRCGYHWTWSRPNVPPTGATANPGTGRPCRTWTTTTSSQTYGAEYRGIVNYYLLASDVWRLGTLHWHAETSMLKTLAAKHQSTVSKMAAKHKAKIETRYGLRTCFEARIHRDGKPDLVARFGGIPLVRDKDAVLVDRVPKPPPCTTAADHGGFVVAVWIPR